MIPLPLARRQALARIALSDGPEPVLPAREGARTIVRHTPALYPTLPSRQALALPLLDAPDGWSDEPPDRPWSLDDWLAWVDRTQGERSIVGAWGTVSTWSDAMRHRDLAAIARWLRDDRSPERIAAHRAAARDSLKAAVRAPGINVRELLETPHALAVHLRDHEALLGLLLAAGAVPDHGALLEAVDHPNPRLAHRLILARPSNQPWNFQTQGLTTPMEAAVSNPWSTVTDLLDRLNRMGTPMDRTGLSREPLLHAACSQGNRRAVRWLLEQGVDPNAWDVDRQHTALHVAAAHNDPVLIDLLVAAGADLHAGHERSVQSRTDEVPLRNTAVHAAIDHGAAYALEALLAHGASLALDPARPYVDDGEDAWAAPMALTIMARLKFNGDGAIFRNLDAQRLGPVVEQALLQRTLTTALARREEPLGLRARSRL